MAKKILTPTEVAQHAFNAGFVGWQVVRATAIAFAESGLNTLALNVNWSPDSVTHLSIDVGLWQINTYFHRTYSIPQLFDPAINAQQAYAIFVNRGGLSNPINGYNAWMSYTNGAHAQFQTQAIIAARAIGQY